MINFYVYGGPLIHCLYGWISTVSCNFYVRNKIEAIYRTPYLDIKVKRGLI